MKTVIWVALVTEILCLRGLAATDPQQDAMLAKAVDILIGENVITEREFVNSSGVSRPTEQTWAFSIITKLSDRPEEIFLKLAESGSYYGLIGLRKYNKDLLRKTMAEFRGESVVYFVSHDSFVAEEPSVFADNLMRDERGMLFERLIWINIPDWASTTRVRRPGR